MPYKQLVTTAKWPVMPLSLVCMIRLSELLLLKHFGELSVGCRRIIKKLISYKVEKLIL
ncbi:MAG: hypothetical protein WCT85_01185 [Parachlamydiales bacterium]